MTDPQLPPPPGAIPPASPAYAPGAAPAPPGYPAAPGHHAPPPGAYPVPVGGYTAPAGAYPGPDSARPSSPLLGMLALISAVLAAVVAPIIAAVAGFEIGRLLPQGITTTSSLDLGILSPARDQVLWAELSFWGGTLLGIAAIVIGIIAIRKKQGRGPGIAALVVAALGPMIFFLALIIAFSAGSATGFAGFPG